MHSTKVFLFLQGPISPFFKLLSTKLTGLGHRVIKINFNLGDKLLWNHPEEYDYRGSLDDWPDHIEKFLVTNDVSDILLLGEQRDYHREAIIIAKRLEIGVTVTDFGYLRPDWITLEKNGMSAESVFPKTKVEIESLAKQCSDPPMALQYHDSFFNQAFWDVIYHCLAIGGWIFFRGYNNFNRHNPIQDYFGILMRLLRRRRVEPRAQNCIKKLISQNKQYFVYPQQLEHDYSIQAYSKFSGNEQALIEILESFAVHAPKNHSLCVKIHPLDPNPFKWRRMLKCFARSLEIDQRIEYLDGGDLDTLISNSCGVVTINSTTGINSLQLGIPTKTLGDSVYDVEGLVDRQNLDEFWGNPIAPDASLLDQFLKAIAQTIQIKGTYYNQPGLDAAVELCAKRLDQSLVNYPL